MDSDLAYLAFREMFTPEEWYEEGYADAEEQQHQQWQQEAYNEFKEENQY